MIKKRIELSRLTTIHLEGWIDVNIVENEKDVLDITSSSIIIGGGSNLLVENTSEIFYKLSNSFSYVYIKDGVLVCGAALKINNLIKFLISHSISSLEFLAGIPATIGGVVYMNAGAFGKTVHKNILYVKVMCGDSGITIRHKEELMFSYRKSNLDDCVILEVGFQYTSAHKKEIENRVAEYIKRRRYSAHLTHTFGSVFKNPFGDYAGRLIEESGLKGLKKGSAMISNKHANYIIGQKKTNVYDVLFLIDKAKESVFKNFGIELEEEVKII